MKMSFTSPPSPAWSWSMMRIVMLRCNGDQVVLRCTWKSDQVILRCKTSSTRWKDPQRLNLRLPLQFYQWNRFFCDLDHAMVLVVILVCMMMINIIHIMLILILTFRLKNLFSIFLLAALAPPGPLHMAQISMVRWWWSYVIYHQSVTSRLEASRHRDFSQFFESIGLGLENFGLEKKSRYRSQKYLVSKKVSVSVSKIFSLKKKSRYRSRKYLVSKKSLGIGLENFGLKKSLGIGLENFGLKKPQ